MSKTIVIIGAGPGVGLAIAERFGKEGFGVALVARDAARLDTLAGRLQAQGIQAAGFRADVLDRPSLTRALGEAAARFGTPDVVEYGPAPQNSSLRQPRAIDIETLQLQLDLGVLGAVAAVNTVLPGFLERKSGTLLFTTAASAQYPVGFTANFGIAAGGVLNYVRTLHRDLKADGIHAGLVAIPGLVVQRGEPTDPEPSGRPRVAAQDVADAHWEHHTERSRPEIIVGDPSFVKGLSGLSYAGTDWAPHR